MHHACLIRLLCVVQSYSVTIFGADEDTIGLSGRWNEGSAKIYVSLEARYRHIGGGGCGLFKVES